MAVNLVSCTGSLVPSNEGKSIFWWSKQGLSCHTCWMKGQILANISDMKFYKVISFYWLLLPLVSMLCNYYASSFGRWEMMFSVASHVLMDLLCGMWVQIYHSCWSMSAISTLCQCICKEIACVIKLLTQKVTHIPIFFLKLPQT